MRSRFKSWAKPYLSAHPEFVLSSLKDDSNFFAYPFLELEIGSGKGAFILKKAINHPSINYLALERDVSISGILGKKIEESQLTNIRLICADLDNIFVDLSEKKFQTIYLNFSDPWPKKKHAKRRLTFAKRLINIASLLQDGGYIYFKTDNDGLYEFTLEEANKVPSIKIIKKEDDYQTLDNDDEMTEYEESFRKEGKSIHRIIFKKEL